MRLIDADELKKYIPSTKVDIFENCRNCRLLDDWQVIDIINSIPTIDPVKHGNWETKEICDGFGRAVYVIRCSECKDEWRELRVENLTNYCPHCGAKMDEVSE